MKETRIAIVGPGRMGIGIATAVLSCGCGYEVKMIDLKDRDSGREFETLDRARIEIASNLQLLKDFGELEASPQNLMPPLSLHRNIEDGVEECAIVFEALPEKPELKQLLLRRLEPLLDEDTIFASATSTINLDTLCQAARNPQRVVIAHWLNPAFIIPLVEVSVGERTSESAAEKMKAFLLQIGKIPVTVKDSPGFIVPRIQVAAMNEAVRILEEGVASPEDIDTAIKAGFGFRLAVLGIMEFIDLGGLDILYYASHFLHDKLGREQYKPLETIVEKMARGEIGPRSGRGFFDYSGVDVDKMFKNRYRGFIELLRLVRQSSVLDFHGGIRD